MALLVAAHIGKEFSHEEPGYWFAILFTTAALCVFSWFTYADRVLLMLSFRSFRWVKAEATIRSVEDNSFIIDSVSQYSTARSTRYDEIKCIYCFKIGGIQYEGCRYSFGGNVDQNWPALSPEGKITVYHDPGDPSQSVVKRVCFTLWLSPLLLLGSIVCALWILVP